MSPLQLQQKLMHVPLENIRSYLTSAGWIQQATIKEVASIWHRGEPEHAEAEIVLPEHRDLRDYWQRLMDVISNLAEFERKSPDRMLMELTLYLCDLVSIRVVHSDVEDGSIPLLDGVLLHERGRDLMIAAAVTTVSKRRNFSGSRPSEANEYLSTLRLGQTAIGSYIVNIIAPVVRSPSSQTEIIDSPFSRVVTTNLVQGLNALLTVVQGTADVEAYSIWDSAVSKGASANMCEALIGLSGLRRNREVTVSVELSKDVQYGNDLTTNFTFSPDHVQTLREVAEYYRDKYVRTGYILQGYVKKLNRDRDNENGIITVMASVAGVDKNVEFELSGADYKLAIQAHDNKEVVSCTGDLHVRPRKVKLLNPIDFRIVTSGKLFSR
jgi:hypothetical protein